MFSTDGLLNEASAAAVVELTSATGSMAAADTMSTFHVAAAADAAVASNVQNATATPIATSTSTTTSTPMMMMMTKTTTTTTTTASTAATPVTLKTSRTADGTSLLLAAVSGSSKTPTSAQTIAATSPVAERTASTIRHFHSNDHHYMPAAQHKQQPEQSQSQQHRRQPLYGGALPPDNVVTIRPDYGITNVTAQIGANAYLPCKVSRMFCIDFLVFSFSFGPYLCRTYAQPPIR